MPFPLDKPVMPPRPILEAVQTTSRMRTLLEVGRARGFVTCDEFHDTLPGGEVTTDDIADLLDVITAAGIDVVDPDAPSQDERDLAFAESMDRWIARGNMAPQLTAEGFNSLVRAWSLRNGWPNRVLR